MEAVNGSWQRNKFQHLGTTVRPGSGLMVEVGSIGGPYVALGCATQ